MTQINTKTRNKRAILIKLFILVGALFLGIFVINRNKTLEAYAEDVIEKCARSEDKASCYDKEIPKLLKSLSMEKVFEVAGEVQEKDSSYVYCHVLGHNIASAETKKDPSKWKEVVNRCPVGVCSNGCVHGAFQEKFREEVITEEKLPEIKKELGNICEARENFNPTPLEQASCYHALGHLFSYITLADTKKAKGLCDELALKDDARDFRPVCFDGVFMQIFQPLEKEDEILVYGKVPEKDEVYDYCFAFEDEARYSCWNESWQKTLGNLPEGSEVVSFCSNLDTHGQEGCYTDIFYILPVDFNFDFNQMSDYCSSFPLPDKRELCFTIMAQRVLEIDYNNKKRAVDFCLKAKEDTLKGGCLEGLMGFSYFVFGSESSEAKELCNFVPEGYKPPCEGVAR